jgi:hypothetical protein
MKQKLPWFLVAGLTLVVILLILFNRGNPKPELQKQAFETQIAILEADKLTAKAVADSIISKQQSDTERIKIVISAKDKEIHRLKTRTVTTRVVIQPMVDTIPALKTHLEAQDSLVASLQIQSDTLKHALYISGKNFMALNVAFQEERRASEKIITESLARIETLQKQQRKTKKGNRLLKVLGVAGTVGAFVLGSGL